MPTKKRGVGKFPHVKGLQCKRTKSGQRWVLGEPDFRGIVRFITVPISDNDPIDVFYRKVNDARQELRRRCACRDFNDYLETFFAVKQLKQKTMEGYRNTLNGFSFDEKKNMKLIRELMRGNYKQSSLKVKLNRIKTFFRWMIQRGEPVKDPTADIVIKAAMPRRTRVLTDEEMGRLLEYARNREPDYRLFILLLIHTGARCSTIGELRPESMDKDWRLHMYNVKSDKRYDYAIPINDRDVRELWKEVASGGALWKKEADIYASALYQWMARVFGRDANGETLSPHSLRHTFATNAVRNGVPIEIVSKLLDHSSPSITLYTYAKFSQEQIDNAVDLATKKGTVGSSSLDLEVSDERQMCKDNREIGVMIDDSVGNGKN